MEPDGGVGQLLKKEKTELETFCLKSSWTADPSDPIIKLKNYLRISHITFFYFYKKITSFLIAPLLYQFIPISVLQQTISLTH